jgi:hypothetical protein
MRAIVQRDLLRRAGGVLFRDLNFLEERHEVDGLQVVAGDETTFCAEVCFAVAYSMSNCFSLS